MLCIRVLAVTLLTCCLGAACGETQAGPAAIGDPPAFDQVRAFADLKHLVEEIGTRRIGTPGAEQTRAYLRKQLEPLGWKITENSFEAVPPEGAQRKGPVQGTNFIARRAGTEAGEIWLATHYDTYDKPGFLGANDGGSSTALLLEIGRQLGGKEPRTGMSLVLAFFDGEEKFPPIAWDDDTNSTFGSRHEALLLKSSETQSQVRAFLLFDLIGDKDLGLLIESSTDSRLRKIFETTAHALGDKRLFVGSQEIKDDHIHFRRLGIPVSNLIDFRYGPNNAFWHEVTDTMENVSAESIGRVGRLALAPLSKPSRRTNRTPRRPISFHRIQARARSAARCAAEARARAAHPPRRRCPVQLLAPRATRRARR